MKKILTYLIAVIIMLLSLSSVYADTDHRTDNVVDNSMLLSEAEETELRDRLEEISEHFQLDVVVVTVDSLDGKSAMEYADDFFDYNGYGYGENHDGILLLVSMEERDWWISTTGYGITAFTDAGLQYISDRFLPLLSDGEYADAFMTYAGLCDEFLKQANKGKPYDTGHMPKEKLPPFILLFDLFGGFVIALCMGAMEKKKLISVRENPVAADYEIPGSFRLKRNEDILVNQFITTRRIQRNSSKGSSGSSSHRSSSGSSHGGRGGKF